MSRNIRQKHPTKTARKASQRQGSDTPSSFSLSDDDGYSAVEEISDSSDDDEEDVDAVEERNILIEAKPSHSPRPQPSSDDDDDQDDDDDDDVDDDYSHFVVDPDADDESTSWAGIASEADEGQPSDFFLDSSFCSDPAVERHVRFDVPSSDSDSTETDDDDDDHGDLFPDIFISQTSLDPAFRREIEHDPDESSGSGSFWDYNCLHDQQRVGDSDAEDVIRELSDDETPTATPAVPQFEASPPNFTPALEEPLELDGYETDGDTTEEDIPDPPIRRKTRRPSVPMSEASDSDVPSPVKSQRGQPRVGRFNLDRSDKKPIAVLNPLTRKMMIFTPHRRRQLDLSPEQFNLPWALEEQSSPILSNSANMMLSAMFSCNTFGDFVNAQTMGPTEAFFPFSSEANAADGSSSASLQGEEDEAEKKLDISDFITWDGSNSSGDEGNDGTWEPSSTPVRPAAASSEREMLSHLNSATVGAFRRNQINQQLILSNKATQDSLAFSGPYNYSAIRGLKSDRFDTAGIPLTPIRRQKKHASEAIRSPLESVSAKRKASGDVGNGHKRHRSISDVNYLRI
ncbi:uncharacterized protein MAM_08389 [Metarhizium album ARSEF 1941]|uniref:Uncharacterized protein n=1 Tax=Metarhizium album (strain ARSEF 1941) TaxID=1081103 RepID=A0A0B2WIV4_METAS|nr:uncharacterized protein MAM_08389 [Metarhizium album ARSEF 1941]KHN93748.1 hypothetical protein MAM_08389 [Metarhizium album ARSEF 1941]